MATPNNSLACVGVSRRKREINWSPNAAPFASLRREQHRVQAGVVLMYIQME